MVNVKVFIDFDGTIILNDVGDAFFARFAEVQDVVQRLLDGSITVAEYYTECCQRLPTNISPSQALSFQKEQQVDYAFTELIELCRKNSIDVRIVSDGFDWYIKPILTLANISAIPIHCNTLQQSPNGWDVGFPGATESCSCFCASCKRNVIITHSADDDVVVYVGDGMSDTCAVQHADIVFAKGYLSKWCYANGVPHHPINNLHQVFSIMRTRIEKNDFKQRRRSVLARTNAFISE